MTPKEKAQELYWKYAENLYLLHDARALKNSYAKKSALIAVEEILEAIDWHAYEAPNKEIFFWEQVKTEIEKL